ncbi:MAG: hypothetical protein MUQ30_09050 [Anaerolineae bacterium]|nr:hypothetical protein [Anaerolineae bacterium]
MEPVTVANLMAFLQRLGERYPGPATLYLLGGSALCLLGSPRATVDVDYTFEVAAEEAARFQAAVNELATEMRLDLEDVPLAEFIPLPPAAHERRQLVGQFGRLAVYIFDPYSIALSKIARGFEADLEDVIFMWREGLIEFDVLECHFQAVLPSAAQADIIPREFREYFDDVRRRIAAASADIGGWP